MKNGTQMSREEIQNEIARLAAAQPWWHDIELPYGVQTRSLTPAETRLNHNIPKWDRIAPFVPRGLKRAIDLGCNEGYFCLKLREIGYEEVVGVDIDANRIEKARFVMDMLQVENVDLIQKSIFELNTDTGRFDFALALGLLHRCPDPYGLLSLITELADSVILEWAASSTHEPAMLFWGGQMKVHDVHSTGYWTPSRTCVKQILDRFGFKNVYDIDAKSSRAILFASRYSLADLLPRQSKPGRVDCSDVSSQHFSTTARFRKNVAGMMIRLGRRLERGYGR